MPKVLSLEKSIDVLEAIFASAEGGRTRPLAKQLGLNVATVHNIAMTFVERGYLRQDPQTKAFLPGLKMALMSRHPACRQSLLADAGDVVDDVARRLNESVMLAMIDRHRVLNLKYVSSRQALRVHEPDDVSATSYGTAVGKLLLSTLSDSDLDVYLADVPLVQHTPKTITDPAALREQLASIRSQGYATASDEMSEGITALAVPIRASWGKVIAGLGASAPTVRLREPEQIAQTLDALREAASAIESAWSTDLS